MAYPHYFIMPCLKEALRGVLPPVSVLVLAKVDKER